MAIALLTCITHRVFIKLINKRNFILSKDLTHYFLRWDQDICATESTRPSRPRELSYSEPHEVDTTPFHTYLEAGFSLLPDP